MSAAIIASAFTLGLLGASHCVSMCSGFASLTADPRPLVAPGALVRRTQPSRPLLLLAQNAGRLTAYVALGLTLGGLGARLGSGLQKGQGALELASGLLLLSLGLFLIGLFPAFVTVERLGGPLFRRVTPFARRLLPLNTLPKAALFGAAWGFVPCGLVYSALSVAAASGSLFRGALVMTAFGLGTLPAVVSVGVVAEAVAKLFARPLVRRAFGVILVGLGVMHVAAAGERLHEGRVPAAMPATNL